MWIPQHLRQRAGQLATIGAAIFVFAMQAVPTFFPRLFGLERAVFAAPALLAMTLLALSLLDRFRPSRWFLLASLPAVWIFMAAAAKSAFYGRVLLFQVCCATIVWVLLNVAPVRESFEAGGRWVERFLLSGRSGAALGAGETARAWDDAEAALHEQELEPVGGGSREPPPSWWVNP